MKLYEHPDFEQAILRAAEHFGGRGLLPAVIEKDYYVTEALRIISVTAGDKVIFKGGTSLSKGWNLIQRFSEDIDIFLDPLAFKPTLGKSGIDRQLKKLRDAVVAHPTLTFIEKESQTIGGFGRNDRFSYTQRFGGPGEVANRVFIEAGAASGASLPVLLSCVHISASFWKRPAPRSVQRMRVDSHCGCCTSGGHLLRRCSPSTAKWNCSSATGSRSEHTPGTITIYFNWPARKK
jgi:hypothetical protein